MQGSDPSRVALFGSVSKTMSPAVGIGWMLTPPAWTDAVRSVDARIPCPPVLDQLAFAAFVQSGSYDRHLRQSRRRYRQRRDNLVRTLATAIPDARISGIAAGLHLLVRFERDVDCEAVVELAAARGVSLVSLEPFSDRGAEIEHGLVVGYGNLADFQVAEAVCLLSSAVAESRKRSS